MDLLTFLRHRVLYWVRHPSHGSGTPVGQVVLVVLLIFVMTLFVYGPLAALGWFLPDIAADMPGDPSAKDLANKWFLWGFVALIPVRFLLHSPTASTTPAYLTLPIQQGSLVHARLGLELVSLHTLVPLSIGVPVILQGIAPASSLVDTTAWTICLLAATAAYSYAGVALNEALGRRSRLFWSVLGATVLLSVIDSLAPIDVFLPLSAALMSRPLVAASALLCIFGLLYGFLYRLRRTTYQVTDDTYQGVTPEWLSNAMARIAAMGPPGQATALELRLMMRHRRTRGIFMMLLAVGPLTCYVFAATQDLAALIVTLQYMAMGIPFAYGVMLFSGDHGHLEGLLARSSRATLLVKGKVRALQVMNTALFVLMGPALAFLSIQDALFLGVWLPYSLLVVAPLSVYFAASTSTPIDLSTSAFAQHTSTTHMLPMVLPLMPAMISVVLYMNVGPWTGFSLPVFFSLIGAASLPSLRRATARKLERRKYKLLHSFRSAEPT